MRWRWKPNVGNMGAFMLVYALTIFLGAFLLFQVQPLIGKFVLPWFGGGPGVWTTCLLFFQLLLLGGYAYAHLSSRRLKPRAQAIVHLVLLGCALASLPIAPGDSWKPVATENPTWQILALLGACIGLPYFVLSSTGPLMQHWFSRTHPNRSPYRLYALSNIGSLLALVSFPFFFETHFSRKAQATLWGCGLVGYAVSCIFCALTLWKMAGQAPAGEPVSASRAGEVPALNPPSTVNRFLWLLLPACASVLLLATTNKICQEVAVIPFLWVLPLALYLLSFVICFDSPRWYVRLPFGLALVTGWAGVLWALLKGSAAPVQLQLAIYCAGLFVCCMVCHGELCRLKPGPRHLTGFYLMIAAGGALGGVFVAIIAPVLFTDFFELHWGMLLCGISVLLVCMRDSTPGSFQRLRLPACAGLLATIVVLGALLWRHAKLLGGPVISRSRNFYGVLKVLKYDNDRPELRYLQLNYGSILHGLQFVDPSRAAMPTSYYVEGSGVGRALQALPAGRRRVGLIGLGAGTLATYARPGDYFHFYEINPEVLRLAGSPFTFLSNCQATVEVTLGDGRLSLEKSPPQNFDLLALDAFNSDAIPVHLLTAEAFKTYERHLATNGIIAVHVSNLSLNFEPVVIALARQLGYKVVTVDYCTTPDKWWVTPSIWMLLSRSDDVIDAPAIHYAARPPRTNSTWIPLWTDDFTSLFQILHPPPRAYVNQEFAETQTRSADMLCRLGDFAGAAAVYRSALAIHPDMPDLLNNLAWLLASCPDASVRNGAEAIRLAEEACRLTHYRTTVIVGTLAAAYAEASRFEDAIETAKKACAVAAETGEEALLKTNQDLLALYQTHQAFRQGTGPSQ